MSFESREIEDGKNIESLSFLDVVLPGGRLTQRTFEIIDERGGSEEYRSVAKGGLVFSQLAADLVILYGAYRVGEYLLSIF